MEGPEGARQVEGEEVAGRGNRQWQMSLGIGGAVKKEGVWLVWGTERGNEVEGKAGARFYHLVGLVSFPCGSTGKESACNAGDLGSIPGSGRSPGEGNGNPLQYSCLENPMDREAW